MSSLKLYFLSSRIAMVPLRKISTDIVLMRRARRVGHENLDDPGIRYQKVIHKDDPEYLESLEEGIEEHDEVKDFLNIDDAYDQHFGEQSKSRSKLRKIIAAKKFFEPRNQPLMLTYNEMSCIKYLHQQDPVQWNVRVLSESFPATPDIIKKVLRAKWKCDPERAKIRDAKVQKNWELLAEGKLDADPDLLEHVKKFVNRRDILLEQMKNTDIYLPEIKEEPVWNNGEMNKILAGYEKSLKKLEMEHLKKFSNKMLPDGSESKIPSNETVNKSNLDKLHEKINEIKLNKNVAGKESFILGKMLNSFAKNVTLEELQENVLKKAENRKPLNLSEKAIIESKLGVGSDVRYKNNAINGEEVAGESTDSQSPQTTKNYSTHHKEKPFKEFKKTSQKFRQKETSVEVESIDEEINEDTQLNKQEKNKLRRKFLFLSSDEANEIPMPDERTTFIDHSEIGQLLNLADGKKPNIAAQQKKVDENNLGDLNEVGIIDPEKVRRENLYYEKEEESIRNTPFWNNENRSEEKAILEFKKAPLEEPKERHQVTQADLCSFDNYPMRIKIPKSKQGSGLTFKVKDCYYDDDGEFLYRVPGMTK